MADSELIISLNGDTQRLPTGSTLADAISLTQLGGQKMAAAINGEFIPRSQYDDTPLHTGDLVDIVKPVGGG